MQCGISKWHMVVFYSEIWLNPTPTLQNRLVRWGLSMYKHMSKPYIIWCGTFNTPLMANTVWAWCMKINGGWVNSGNQIASGPMNFELGFDTIIEFVVESNSTLQNRLVRWKLSPLINIRSDHILSDMSLLTVTTLQLSLFENIITPNYFC